MFFIFALAFITTALGLSEVNEECIANNNEDFSNDFLLGSWHEIYKFTIFELVSTSACGHVIFTRPSGEELQKYREKYSSSDSPYSFDDNPLIRVKEDLTGVVMGHKQAKFYVLSPDSAVVLNNGYSVDAYVKLNDDYIMYSECSMRGNIRWLLSKRPDAPAEEVQDIINQTPELKRLVPQKQCA